MMLSRHFALSEFTDSSKARLHNVDNIPPAIVLSTLAYTAAKMEEVRELLGRNPITITSGYRSPALNKLVGGKPTSQHMLGEAVDFICPGFGSPTDIVAKIKHSDILYDQVIREQKGGAVWVHASFRKTAPRKQALWADESGTRAFA